MKVADLGWSRLASALSQVVFHCPAAYAELFLIVAVGGLLSGTPQSCKPCRCPVSRQKKEPRDSDRDIHGLLNKGSGSSPLLCVADSGQDKAEVLDPWG